MIDPDCFTSSLFYNESERSHYFIACNNHIPKDCISYIYHHGFVIISVIANSLISLNFFN